MSVDKLTIHELTFFAGFLEGDGYFGNQLKVQSIDEELLLYFSAVTGAKFRTCKMRESTPNRQQLYEIYLGRKDRLSAWYQKLYPFLGTRRQSQIQKYFEHYKEDYVAMKSLLERSDCPSVYEYPVEPDFVLSEMQADWLAGYFIAEGSIGYSGKTKRPYITFSSVDEDVISFVALLLGQKYSVMNRPTARNKKVFRVDLHRFTRLQYILQTLEPLTSVSPRHYKKIQGALSTLSCLDTKREACQTSSAKHLAKEVEIKKVEDNEALQETFISRTEAEQVAAIFDDQTTFIVYILELKGRWRTPRLRVESPDKEMIDFLAKIFDTKSQFVKVKRRTGEKIYRAQTENRPRVLSILESVRPFVSVHTLPSVEKGLEYVKTYKL